MPDNHNIHDLSRPIPESIKRKIRQECGFGCVICGHPIVQYEHIDPLFANATEHDPSKIALLCGTCHDKVSRGRLSKESILIARKNPRTFEKGLQKDSLDFKFPLTVIIGNNEYNNFNCIVRARTGEEWFSISPPERPNGPPRLHVVFLGKDGKQNLTIHNNEWICTTGFWDLETKGKRTIVREGHRNIMLELEVFPPHGIKICSLKMCIFDACFEVKPNGVAQFVRGGINIAMTGTKVTGADAIYTLF